MNGVGAVVVGGDYQGLGIVRSLGRRGIPVCIVDDERSIGRFSRYATASVRVGDLRDERRCADTLLAVAARHRLDGWVVYPTREETVAACSRYRDELSRCFRVPTPGWETIRFAWDKRNTHERAQELGIPTARTWWPADEAELGRIEADLPLVIKPAIKEHFLYATRAKAWRVDTREELRRR
nr:ATP-grasp domain-containing protein [Acidobacteriota bacterium]